MQDFGTQVLNRGEDFLITISLGEKKKIESSTSANPSVITITNHGYTTSTKKQIKDHVGNTAINNNIDNLFHTITVIDSHTFSVPIDGTTNGGMTGTCLTPANLTSATVECHFRSTPIKSSTTPTGTVLFEPTVAVLGSATDGTITISVEKASTYIDVLTLDKYYADILVQTSGGSDKFYGKFVVDVKPSSSRI